MCSTPDPRIFVAQQRALPASAVNEALKSDDVIKSLNAQTIAPLIGTQADYVKHLDNERKRWTPIIESAGLRK